MSTQTAPTFGTARGRILAFAFVIAATVGALLPSALLAQDGSPMPGAAASLEPSIAPALTACESAEDLGLIIEFIRATDPAVDGWVPIVVGVIAGLSEARTLAGLIGSTYEPLIDDLIVSLQGLRAAAEGLQDQETLGAKLAALGTAVTDVGNAMDSLSVQLQATCPTAD